MNTPKDAAIITLVGAAGVACFGIPIVRSFLSRSWPKAEGRVLSSQKVPTSNRSVSFRLVVQYSYSVAGLPYTSQRRSFADTALIGRSWTWTKEVQQKYSVGNTIDVYYNPSSPADCILTRQLPWTLYFGLAISILFLFSGVSVSLRLLHLL